MIDVIRIVDRTNVGIFNSWIFDSGLFLYAEEGSKVYASYPALSTLIYATKHDVVCPCGEDFGEAVFLYKLSFVKSVLGESEIFALCNESREFNLTILYGRVDTPFLFQDGHQVVVPITTASQLKDVGVDVDSFTKFISSGVL